MYIIVKHVKKKTEQRKTKKRIELCQAFSIRSD